MTFPSTAVPHTDSHLSQNGVQSKRSQHHCCGVVHIIASTKSHRSGYGKRYGKRYGPKADLEGYAKGYEKRGMEKGMKKGMKK